MPIIRTGHFPYLPADPAQRDEHHDGLNLRWAQINRVPRALGFQWDRRCLANEAVKLLLARGPEIRAQLITHVVPYDDAPAFIARLVGERPEFLQIVFKVGD